MFNVRTGLPIEQNISAREAFALNILQNGRLVWEDKSVVDIACVMAERIYILSIARGSARDRHEQVTVKGNDMLHFIPDALPPDHRSQALTNALDTILSVKLPNVATQHESEWVKAAHQMREIAAQALKNHDQAR